MEKISLDESEESERECNESEQSDLKVLNLNISNLSKIENLPSEQKCNKSEQSESECNERELKCNESECNEDDQEETKISESECNERKQSECKERERSESECNEREQSERSDNLVQSEQKQSFTKHSIDRKKNKVKEKIPDHIAQLVVEEVLSLVGDMDWNDPMNVSKTIAKIMSIDLNQDIESQNPRAFDVDKTVLVKAKNKEIPFWICQSVIRVDDKKGNRYIEYNGSKYNKIDIIFGNKYFKQQMDKVAKYADCVWNARWGNSSREQNKLYNKTRPGYESWLDKCVKPILKEDEVNGIDIRDLVMIEFKRNVE